ncbi:MAG: hypothetical protein R3C11_05285 [Planctomycetaceae bacterium]
MMVYFGGDGEYQAGTAIYGMRLPAGKTEWTSPVVLARDTPREWTATQLSGRHRVKNSGYSTSPATGKNGVQRIKLKISTDGGQTFSDSMLVTEEIGYMVRNKPIIKNDGNYLIPILS